MAVGTAVTDHEVYDAIRVSLHETVLAISRRVSQEVMSTNIVGRRRAVLVTAVHTSAQATVAERSVRQ